MAFKKCHCFIHGIIRIGRVEAMAIQEILVIRVRHPQGIQLPVQPLTLV